MANEDKPHGFRPIRMTNGLPYCGQGESYSVDASNGTAIFVGDVIMAEADGNVAPATAGSAQVIGVCVGVKVDRSTGATEHPGYLPASTAGTIQVEGGPDVVFEAQEDSVSSDLALIDVFSGVDHVAGAGSTTTGVSAHEIDSDSTTTSGTFRVLRLYSAPDNEVGTNARWEVVLTEHTFNAATAV